MGYEDLMNKIEEYLPVRNKEKEKFGEVFTPPALINELLDHLPHNVWSNPDFKWLDPACGIGNFFMIVFYRLMAGLASKIPNKNKRSNHILKNMLFMIEINPKNIKIARSIFGVDINIIDNNFLSDTIHFKDNFDIIIGNLPFNEEPNKNNKKTLALWPKFVIKSFDILNKAGFLAFIHPPHWRSPGNKLWHLLSQKHILYLHIYGPDESKLFFNVNTKVDLYVLQNSEIKKSDTTMVVDELGEKQAFHLQDFAFLPNYKIKQIIPLLNSTSSSQKEKQLKIIHDSFYSTAQTHEIKNDTYKYPVISSITAGNKLHLRYASSKDKRHFNIPKAIIDAGRRPYPLHDFQRTYAMTQ